MIPWGCANCRLSAAQAFPLWGCLGGDPGWFWGSGVAPRPPLSPGLSQAVQGGRVKRYSSQRQRPPVPEPAPPMHISIVEGHYYDPRECFPPCVFRAEQLEQGSPTLPFVAVALCPLMQCPKGSWEPAWLCLNLWNYP